MTRFELTGHDSRFEGFREYPHRVQIAGTENGFPGYGILLDVEKSEASTYGHAGVIDNNGGSRRELDRLAAKDLLVKCEAGDVLALDGTDYLVVVDARRYPSLVLVTDELDVEAEVAKVAGLRLFRSYHG